MQDAVAGVVGIRKDNRPVPERDDASTTFQVQADRMLKALGEFGD